MEEDAMEENLAYDQGPVQASAVEDAQGTRRRKAREVGEAAERGDALPDEIREGNKLAMRMSAAGTMGGMYGLLLTSLGIAFPVSEYTSSEKDARLRDSFDTGFRLYVYTVGLVIQIYISMAVMLHGWKNKKHRKNAGEKGDGTTEIETSFGGRHLRTKTASNSDLYVVEGGEGGGEEGSKGGVLHPSGIPWHLWSKIAPPIYETKYGFNVFTRAGILVFGASAVALDICRLVEYADSGNASCYGHAMGALIVIRLLFFISQIVFLLFHHKVVLNFHHPLVKLGSLHLVATNIIAWVKIIAFGAIDILDLEQQNRDLHGTPGHTVNYTTMAPHASGSAAFADFLCKKDLVLKASRYLGPLVIGYCVLAAAVIYRMYGSIGPTAYIIGHPVEVWERQSGSSEQGESPQKAQCRRPNLGVVLGMPLFLITLGLTIWVIILDTPKDNTRNLRTMGEVHTACDLAWNIILLAAVVPAFYALHKLRYQHSEVSTVEHLLSAVLGGTFILLCFMTVASFMFINDHEFGGRAKMAVPGCLMNFIQSTAMFAFTADAWRRRLRNADEIPGKDEVSFLILGNLSMWLVTSFMSKVSFGSYLFYRRFSILPWVLIVNTTLPLAMFFRFLICIMLTDVLRTTYGMHVRKNRCLLSR